MPRTRAARSAHTIAYILPANRSGTTHDPPGRHPSGPLGTSCPRSVCRWALLSLAGGVATASMRHSRARFRHVARSGPYCPHRDRTPSSVQEGSMRPPLAQSCTTSPRSTRVRPPALKATVLASALLLAVGCTEQLPTVPAVEDPKPSLNLSSGDGPTIGTDRQDYAPGETVEIVGWGW